MNDTYESFSGKTIEQVKELFKLYSCKGNLEQTQNESPSVQEFFDLATEYPFIAYIGYVVKKPRTDYRLSIEGFEITNLTADDVLDLYEKYDSADEKMHNKIVVKGMPILYHVRFWWD